MADHQSHTVGRVCIHAEGRGTYKSSPAEGGVHARFVQKHLRISKTPGSNREFVLLDVQHVCRLKQDCAEQEKKKHNKTGRHFNKPWRCGGGHAKK